MARNLKIQLATWMQQLGWQLCIAVLWLYHAIRPKVFKKACQNLLQP